VDAIKVPNAVAYGGTRPARMSADTFFYDMSSLLPAEVQLIHTWFVPEGAFFVVQPGGPEVGIGSPFSLDEWRAKPELAGGATALAVAGVGSSSLGTAALARNVADAIQKPVLGMVSGFGIADLLGEALGGFLVFRSHNQVNQALDLSEEYVRIAFPGNHWIGDTLVQRHKRWRDGVGREADSIALRDALQDANINLDLIVSHSKGNFLIADALRAYVAANPAHPRDGVYKTRIITIGAVVDIPGAFENVTQYLGSLDALGRLNSLKYVPYETLPGKAHSLNRVLPYMLPIDAVALVGSAHKQNGKKGIPVLPATAAGAAHATAAS
jgi:hypothetical protein